MAKPDFWDLLDLLASFRVSWSPIARGDTRVLEPVRVAITSVGLRILVEATRESLAITFYRGDEYVFDDEAVLVAHMRDAGAKILEAPCTILDLMATMRSLGRAPHALEQSRDDNVKLTFLTPTTLVELDFFDDHIEYSVFEKQAPPASWEDLVAELGKFTRE
jgi:hypothetical protein